MILSILIIVVSIVAVIYGADKLTEGSVGIAERMGLPQLVIGLTIVAMGTSMPEFCISLISSLKGTADLAVGNVVGSNIFNAMLIVGCAALVSPMVILPTTVRKDIPFALVASVVLLLVSMDGDVSRLDAAVLMAMFFLFMYFTLRGARMNTVEVVASSDGDKKPLPAWKALGLVLFGLTALIFGSNFFVDHATAVARSLGVSDAVIGLTIVAGGTSLPELATSIVAARKGNSGIAIGNVLGSNVFNILFILGATGLVSPMRLEGITSTDMTVLIVSMILLWLFSFTKYTIQRWEGALLVAGFAAYMSYLLSMA
ncbi:calcium/sodium antiporter [Segatella baroniae]|uniref:K+-dependent Na+/Ca+ exchanger family protein n=1 Tax=Segatella baroniae F0067 TaxID=1115809 RepID=U2P2S9_9BACT|nr:calcium/sodium antiporter [Segatella baroniae]ERK38461.1 K+-dependent Na+/Ca+ exchanger family protein [Segatella baroniae F0067]